MSLEGKIAKNGTSCRIDLLNNQGRITLRNDFGSSFRDGESVWVVTRPKISKFSPTGNLKTIRFPRRSSKRITLEIISNIMFSLPRLLSFYRRAKNNAIPLAPKCA